MAPELPRTSSGSAADRKEGRRMPRWTFMLGVGLVVVAVAFVVTNEVLGPPQGLTRANVKRIKPGLTVRQVVEILGCGGHAPKALENYRGDGGLAFFDAKLQNAMALVYF